MIETEHDILQEEVRKALIKGFLSQENECRKAESFRAYECLKDKTKNYVIRDLYRQFDPETVAEMVYAISNVSILRKVIDKLAKVYSNGVKRTIPDNEKETKDVETIAEIMTFNEQMKKLNRYYRTFKNALAFPKPIQQDDGKFTFKLEVLAPFNYDVIENPKNREEPLCVILSDYTPTRPLMFSLGDAANAGRNRNEREVRKMSGTPAPLLEDDSEDKREWVWWSKNYHFTTNSKGKIISGAIGTPNPIGVLPFVNFAGDRDNTFWAEGGEDLVDSGININSAITNAKHIAVSQGYGQMYMIGSKLPKSIKVGPNHCIQLEYTKDEDAEPTVGYMNSNPPLQELKELIEMDVALMLTTNNLSTSGVAVSLGGGKDFASGVAMIIDKSESIEDTNDQQKIFVAGEPKIWTVLTKWHDLYKSKQLLIEELQILTMPKKPETISLSFPQLKPIVSEKEHLEVLEMRKEMGLNTEVEIMMRDDPSLSEEEAEAKIEKIKEEKQANMEEAVENAAALGGGDGNQGNENGGVPNANNGNPGNNQGAGSSGQSKNQNQE